ncbi:hypothetical protein BH11PLA2_BH11PLA2_27070 [soil metagenome]
MNSRSESGVDELAAEFLAAVERGESPDPAEWLAQHPAHAAELAGFLADLGRFAPLLGLAAMPANFDRTAAFRPSGSQDAEPKPGDRFGEYELVAQIGAGGMGVVYQATLAGTSLVVALKRLETGAGDDEACQFREEVEAVVGLRHPNIVPIYHVGENAGRPHFTMPLAEGGSLDQHLGRFRGPPRAAVDLMIKVARAVHHAHQRQIVHRDLKPANILLDASGEPQVADFGLATRLDATGEADAESGGSLPWMAPEALRGEPVTTGVDVWALGVILYELLTSTRPFRGTTRAELQTAILNHNPLLPLAVNPQIPPDLSAVCMRCLEKEPDRRYESASAVALELDRWRHDRPVRARTPTRRERIARWYRHNPVPAWGALLLSALLAGAAVLGVVLADEQAAALRKAVCQANEHTAGHVANSVLLKLDDMSQDVSRAAVDSQFHVACRSGDQARMETELLRLFPAGRTSFETVYVLDSSGVIVALVMPGGGPAQSRAAGVVGKAYRDRDYFKGAIKHRREDGAKRVHVSRVFRSDADGYDKFAISCLVQPDESATDGWVVAATLTTHDTLGLINLQGHDQKTALLAPRDPSSARGVNEPDGPAGYLVLVHESFHGKKGAPCVPFPSGQPGPVPDANDRPELSLPATPGEPPFAQNQNYRDPVTETGQPDFAERWLSGSARVGNTELVVVVQQRDSVAVAAQRSFFVRFAAWAGGVAVLGLFLFIGLSIVRARRAGADLREEK